MTDALTLPERLDLTAAKPLARDLAAMTGAIRLDASGVTHLGGLCLQVLLGAARGCRASGRGFSITDRSPDFDAALALFGVDLELLAEEAG
ncbi:STAS domain-containing protein [Paracoccus sediminicola]|uniref:STAS domain-containing protein n=1 Tax=Paracoccus sediminicola TaxID=3017783 RepID=UPI0022F01FC3|nr:STAS domain-containing protein [Paracoccus sediminicola]WBU58166.1 STAS domain-containing protein [Paracoccus sediminicola]